MSHPSLTPSSFPPSIRQTLTITPPPASSPRRTNILLLLHGLGDTPAPYTALAQQLSLPQTTCISLRGPQPVPFLQNAYHWGEDIVFSGEGTLDMDAGFGGSVGYLCAVLSVLVGGEAGYTLREIFLLGMGQGGMCALEFARQVFLSSSQNAGPEWSWLEKAGGGREFGGVISFGGPLPSSTASSSSPATKCPTPILICAGPADFSAVTPAGEALLRNIFEFVEVVRWERKRGRDKMDGMPRSRAEMLPVMRFLARRLRSRAGVPEGAVEVGVHGFDTDLGGGSGSGSGS